MSIVETNHCATARGVAYAAHFGQYDRDGHGHIAHVERVVNAVVGGDYEVQAAWLHDVVEDTDLTFEFIATMGFSGHVVEAVRLLTRDEDLTYLEYVANIAEATGEAGKIARAVKLADLNDNLRRCEADGNTRLARRYRRGLALILEGV